jgi:hypothetical protein
MAIVQGLSLLPEAGGRVRPRLVEFGNAGSQVAVIGTSWPAAAKGFAEKSDLPASVPVLVDRDRRSFSLLGLRRSLFATLFSRRSAAPDDALPIDAVLAAVREAGSRETPRR